FLWHNVEVCDDGNLDNSDGCEASCVETPIMASLGPYSTCVQMGPNVRCWGRNDWGNLGLGNTVDRGDDPGEMPTPFIDLGGDVVSLGSGSTHVCVLQAGGVVRCWGRNDVGQLGYGHTSSIGDQAGEMPPAPVDVGGTAVQLAVGGSHNCVLLDDDTIRCWGANSGRLGYGNTDNLGDGAGEMPPPPVDVGGTPVQIFAGPAHSCVLLATGEVRCWGSNNSGRLGYGHTDTIGDQPGEMPPPAVALGPGNVVQISGSNSHTCAVFDDGT